MKRLTIAIFFAALLMILPGRGLAAEFGYVIAHDTVTGISTANCWGNQYADDTHLSDGTEHVIKIKMRGDNYNNNTKVVFGIYTYSGGHPAELAYTSDTLSLTGSGIQWFEQVVDFYMVAGNYYTLAVDVVSVTNPGIARHPNTTGGCSADSNDTFQANWSHTTAFNIRLCLSAEYEVASCAVPSQTPEWIYADTSNHGRLMMLNTYGTSVIDSIEYFYDDDLTIVGATKAGAALEDSGTTHTVIIADLQEDTDYRVWAIAWNHLNLDLCADTVYVDAHTGKSETDETPPTALTWSIWGYQPFIRAGSAADSMYGDIGDSPSADYDSIRIIAKVRELPASNTDGTLVYAGGAVENTQVILTGFPAPYIDSIMVIGAFIADTAGNWTTCNADTIVMPHADSSVSGATLLILAEQQKIRDSVNVSLAMLQAGVIADCPTALEIAQSILRDDSTGRNIKYSVGWLIDKAGDTASFYYDGPANVLAVKSQTDKLQFSGSYVQSDAKQFNGSTIPDSSGYLKIAHSMGNVAGVVSPVSITQTFPTNFADLWISATTGRVSVGNNYDKTGYSLTQTFPANFGAMKISATGYVSLNLADYAGSLNSAAFGTGYWSDISNLVGSGGTGTGDCAIPESLLATVPMITSIKANTDAWASLQFDTLQGRVLISASMVGGTGIPVYPAFIQFRPVKADSTAFSKNDGLTTDAGLNTRSVTIAWITIRASADSLFLWPIIPNSHLSVTTSLYEFIGYYNYNGQRYEQIRVVVAVPEDENPFNPFD